MIIEEEDEDGPIVSKGRKGISEVASCCQFVYCETLAVSSSSPNILSLMPMSYQSSILTKTTPTFKYLFFFF